MTFAVFVPERSLGTPEPRRAALDVALDAGRRELFEQGADAVQQALEQRDLMRTELVQRELQRPARVRGLRPKIQEHARDAARVAGALEGGAGRVTLGAA